MPKKLIAFGLAIIAITLTLALTLPDSRGEASQTGLRGFWTTQQKQEAQSVLTSAPVLESPELAACVIAEVSQEHDFTQFERYANMAKANDFSSPDSAQQEVIYSLMYDAMTCPESH